MASLKETVHKTGYRDIDELLLETHHLLNEMTEIQKDIEKSLKYEPYNPYSKPKLKKRLNLQVEEEINDKLKSDIESVESQISVGIRNRDDLTIGIYPIAVV